MATQMLYVTCSSSDEAMKIASGLVEGRLAACANILPGMTSVYRWEGKIESDSEVVLIVKTASARVEKASASTKEE